MPRACVLLAPGFEEIEAVTVIDVLRRAEVDTAVVAVCQPTPDGTAPATSVEGSHGISVSADVAIDRAEGPWDAIVLPGGMPGSAHLRDDERVRDLLRRQHAEGKICAAICAAPIALAAAGVLTGRTATSYPAFRAELGCSYSEEAVVVDGNVITSRGPATSLAFALTLVARLCGDATASGLAARMLA